MIGVVYLGNNPQTEERLKYLPGRQVIFTKNYYEAAEECKKHGVSDHFILFFEKSVQSEDVTAITYLRKISNGIYIILLTNRPYFMLTSEVPASAARKTTRGVGESVQSIIFSEEQTQLHGDEDREQIDEAYSLSIYAKRKKIVVESALKYTTDVRIVNTAGITMATFTIEPGETVETRINNSGVYIVQTSDARYTKKLAVK